MSRTRSAKTAVTTTDEPMFGERNIWYAMIRRCTKPSHPQWKDYGGRGITVCQEWQNSFEAFFIHIGPRPDCNHTLDRINNEGNYEPGNVRWATQKEQNYNRRSNIDRILEHKVFRLAVNKFLSPQEIAYKLNMETQTVKTILHGLPGIDDTEYEPASAPAVNLEVLLGLEPDFS